KNAVTSVAISDDGHRIVSGSRDTTVKVWDIGKGAGGVKLLRTLPGHTATVNSVAISSNGTRIVSGSDDKTVRIWDIDKGGAGAGKPPLVTLTGHTSFVTSVAISADGTRIVSGGGERREGNSDKPGEVHVWDIDKRRAGSVNSPVLTLQGH